jgi:hypothetical protein
VKDRIAEWFFPVALVVASLLLVFGIWWASSYAEARAYSRITGSNVSTWDAMFVELRVQEGAKK